MTASAFNPVPPVFVLSFKEAKENAAALGDVLRACVEGGAGVGFVLPFTQRGAEAFWKGQLEALEAGSSYLLVARLDGRIVGTVMLQLAQQDNGQHRAEIAKLLVHPDARRKGLARRLLAAADELALSLGRTLLVLDTVTGDTAESIYPKCGYVRVGVIPDYAVSAAGALDSTTVFYKQLA
jgi:GNAT superfamily N-acetyltransferase